MRNKILMTLALLLTAVTGAWAQTETPLVTIQASENSTFTSGSKTFNDIATVTITGNGYIDDSGWEDCTLTVTPADGVTITSVKFYGSSDGAVVEDTSSPFEAEIKYDSNLSREVTKVNGTKAFDYGVKKIEVFGTAGPPLIVEWDAATKTGTFTMPAFDVEIAPIYAPVAQWAKVENVDQLPTAIEGIYAESTDAIVKAGTVAKIGETENAQGIVMYAVTSTNQATAPELSAFSADVPTAKDITVGSDVLVWYYIKGADTPTGEEATAENTFNDSEICATPITVTVLSNKFDINFKAANDNTIETGKATVTVGGTAATVTEGKLTGVKMGSEVKITAKKGYIIEKVEVKKGATTSTLLSAATTSDVGKVVCAAGHLHDAKTAVPNGCTAVGILGKVTETGHGLILALKDATAQRDWNTINNWTSASYAGTTLKVLHNAVRGTNLTSYTTLGETTVSNWAVAQYEDYKAIFENLGSTTGDSDGMTYDANVNAYITTGVGGTAISGTYWSATEYTDDDYAWVFVSNIWNGIVKTTDLSMRPVLGF